MSKRIPVAIIALVVLLAPTLAKAETVMFEVQVPSCTPVGAVVYLRSNRLAPDTWVHDELTPAGPNLWTGVFDIEIPRDQFQYKYSHSFCDPSSCVGVEKSLDYTGSGGEVDYRTLAAGVDRVQDLVFIWRDALVHFDGEGAEVGLRTEDEQVAFCDPYLSVSSVDGAEITVGYHAYDAGELVLEWGRTEAYGERIIRSGEFQSRFVLDDLEPGATYHYRVTEDGVPGQDNSFRAPVRPGDPFRFVHFGDTQYYEDQQRLDHRSFVELAQEFDPNLVTCSGDMVASLPGDGGPGGYMYPEMGRWSLFFGNASPLMATAPFMTAMGNHEEDAPFFWNAFASPEPDAPAIDHYDFRFGSLHFLVLYTGTTDSYDVEAILESHADWLQEALAAGEADATVRWTVVVLHRGVLSQGGYHPEDWRWFWESETPTRPSWRELWRRHGVDLVLGGHNHNFTLAESEGIRFISSCSGAPTHGLIELWAETTIYAERTCAIHRFTVGERTISYEPVRIDGSVISEAVFTLCQDDADCEELENPCEGHPLWSCEDSACRADCSAPPDGDGDADADGDIPTDGDADADATPDGDSDGDSDVDSDGDIDADGDLDGDGDFDAEGVGEPDDDLEVATGCSCRAAVRPRSESSRRLVDFWTWP